MPVLSESDVNRFYSKVAITANSNKCWEWLGGKRRRGYGRFSVNHTLNLISHRVSYFLSTRIDPIGYVVAHRCDNPGCVNPNHLFHTSNQGNMDDMKMKKRHHAPSGELHGGSRLTVDDVSEIKKLYKSGISQRKIANMYGYCQQGISRIVLNKNWKHHA